MQVFHTNHQGFKGLLACFSERPKQIPVFSFIVADEKKPIALFCIYHDSGVAFLHGLFKSKFANIREMALAVKHAESYLANGLTKSFSIVVFTEKKWLSRILEKNNFASENIKMFSRMSQ